MQRSLASTLLLFSGLLLSVDHPRVCAADEQVFVTARNGKLYEGDHEFRFVSWNIPNLHNVEDAFEFLGSSPWRWPDEYEIADALESVNQMGGRVVRTYVISVRREGSDMGSNVHVLAPGEFNEEAFRVLDLVLKVARDKGVRVILPLVDNWHWWGGVRQYEGFRGKPEGAFWTDPEVIEDFKKTVRYVVERRNTLTGVAYRDDPTILAWETGNELDSTPDWTSQIAAYLKELDPNHLVIDGNALNGPPVGSVDDPNIDIVTTHHYPNVGNNTAESVVEAMNAIDGRKAYFVGEFGFLPVEEAQRMLDTVIERGASGALYWSLRFHRREGGFYWHHEASGQDLFKAYHWPGFPEGRPYREHLVLPMLREAAYRIQGIEPPEVDLPAAPTMLPCESPGLLSWQGSTGASGYDVHRAMSSDGPWEKIATNVSDAATQYRPLYADEQMIPKQDYYYRVVARNGSGASTPSNVIGPVRSDTRLLVDEMSDQSRLAYTEGTIATRSSDERRVQEDIHRLEISPGASITYKAEGSIREAKLWLFAESDDQPIDLADSPDGEQWFPCSVERQTAPPPSTGDYAYLRPILLTVEADRGDAKLLRIRVPEGGGSSPVQVSRVELRWVDAP